MAWDELKSRLSQRTGRDGARSVPDRDLEDYFGPEKLARLQRLAERVRLAKDRRAHRKGNIVFVPGIMGSELSVTENGDEDLVWVSYWNLIWGDLDNLRLAPDGIHEANPDLTVRPTGLDKDSYAEPLLWLEARWNVKPFPYDWRKDLDKAAEDLKDFVVRQFPERPVHLVAHSMGGLLCRNFIRLYPKVWKAMADPKKVQGGRLIMLGTPSYGSYAIANAMAGEDGLVRKLALADVPHDLFEVLEILNTFVGSYQLLPSPAKIPASEQSLYERATWGRHPIAAAHLQRAKQFHQDLDAAPTIDPERMVYIAGCNQDTLTGVTVESPGVFEFQSSLKGDGRVPHALGLLPSVPTYYVDEIHGDLQTNEQVLQAVEEILEKGHTTVLPTQPIADRGVRALSSPQVRAVRDRQAAKEIAAISELTRKNLSTPEQRRRAERLLRQALLAQAPREDASPKPQRPTDMEGQITPPGATAQRAKMAKPLRKLTVEVVHGHICDIKAPAVVAGHYRGVEPVRAVGALDQALHFWISKAMQREMIGGGLGEVFFIPTKGSTVKAGAVILAGMGDYGRFNREDLTLLFANVTDAVTALGWREFATVVVGSGEGNLSLEQAVEGMVEGITTAFTQSNPRNRLKILRVVELSESRVKAIRSAFEGLAQNTNHQLVRLSLKPLRTLKGSPRPPAKKPEGLAALKGSRITVERERDVFRFSAITEQAVIPVREISIQSSYAEGAAEELKAARTQADQKKYGKLLHSYLMPEDFQEMLDKTPLTLMVDRSTAAFPWEMAAFDTRSKTVFYGIDRQLSRQFRTTLSAAPGLDAPPRKDVFRVLVIADPAHESELQLPGAQNEGRAVVQLFRDMKPRKGLKIMVEARIGPYECDPVELLALVLSEEFDLIHYAGHADFDEKNPSKSGWILGMKNVLSARDIFRARRVPRLIFANACFSGVIRSGKAFSLQESNQSLAGLAQAFFERGVRNYIGTGWPVDDAAALTFAQVFYTAALDRNPLGTALSKARAAIQDQGSTWGAYQHYGQATDKLINLSNNNATGDL